MILSEWVWGIVALILTIMVLSYLIGDNLFFRLAAQIFVGLITGYVTVLIFYTILWPHLIVPLVKGAWIQRLWMLIPLLLIGLLLMSQIRRFANLGRFPLAFLAGITSALVIGGAVFGTLLPQSQVVVEAFSLEQRQAVPDQTWLRIVEAVLMLFGVIGTLSYFHFGRKQKTRQDGDETQRPGLFEGLSKVGQVFIGITLGAIFAGVFSTALFALIDRILFVGRIITIILGVR